MQHGKTQKVILPSAAFMDAKDEIMANAEMFAPLAWPMLIHHETGVMRRQVGTTLMRSCLVMTWYGAVTRHVYREKHRSSSLTRSKVLPIDSIPFVVEVAETLFKQGIAVGKFIPVVEMPLPPKPVDIADNKDARQGYKRAAAHVMDVNAQAFKKSCRTRMTMDAVEKYKDRERFYLPWSFDYRGRAYPIPAFLTPQDTDFGKSLLQFADAAFITNDCS